MNRQNAKDAKIWGCRRLRSASRPHASCRRVAPKGFTSELVRHPPTKVERALGRFGVTDIVTAQTVHEEVCGCIASFDAVFMGGGNTCRLLHRSAGAIVLGANIGTCAFLDENESGINDLRALDRCDGAAVWCHYVEGDGGRIIDFIRETGVDVLSLPENAGVRIDSAGLHSARTARDDNRCR